jgi:hypothetical protein
MPKTLWAAGGYEPVDVDAVVACPDDGPPFGWPYGNGRRTDGFVALHPPF